MFWVRLEMFSKTETSPFAYDTAPRIIEVDLISTHFRGHAADKLASDGKELG